MGKKRVEVEPEINPREWAEFKLDYSDEHKSINDLVTKPLLGGPGVLTTVFVAYAYVDDDGDHCIGYRVAGDAPFWTVGGAVRTALDCYESNFNFQAAPLVEDEGEEF